MARYMLSRSVERLCWRRPCPCCEASGSPGSATPPRLGHLLILALDLLHGVGFEFLGTPVQPNK